MATIKELAEHLDLSSVRVHDLFNENILIKSGKSGGQDLDDCRVKYIRYLRSLSKGKNTSSGDLNDERTRLTKAQADRAELELQEKENILISTEIVEKEWVSYISNIRSKLLGLPTKLGHNILTADDYNQAENMIKDAIIDLLTELEEDARTQS